MIQKSRNTVSPKVSLNALLEEIARIRSQSETIMLVPQPTGNSWRGIYHTALGFAPGHFLALPQYYSQTRYSKKELQKLCCGLMDAGFSKIIFSGFPAYFSKMITFINQWKIKGRKNIQLFVIYHGSLSSNRENSANIEILKEILELQQSGKIHRIGFIKKGLAQTFRKLTGANAFHLIPQTPLAEINRIQADSDKSKLHLGVFTHDQYRKNIDNQIAAALMIPEAIVHTHDNYQFEFLQSGDRLCFHPFMESYPAFLALVKSMYINFYVTFSECFGLFIAESLALGVPCLASDNSGILDYDEWLNQKLIVKEFDNSNAIYEHAKMVLDHHDEVAQRGVQYISSLQLIADAKYQSFLNA